MAPARRRPRRPRAKPKRKPSRKAPAPRRAAPAKPAAGAGRKASRRTAPADASAAPVSRRRSAHVASATIVPAPHPGPSPAERRLLEIARRLTALGEEPGALPRALRALADAYAPDGALPGALFAAWAASRDDKTAALALAWAREQVRLALQELIERAPPGPPRRTPAPETLAWLLLAGAEAICQEPPSAAADRLRALLELAGEAELRPSEPFRPRELR